MWHRKSKRLSWKMEMERKRKRAVFCCCIWCVWSRSKSNTRILSCLNIECPEFSMFDMWLPLLSLSWSTDKCRVFEVLWCVKWGSREPICCPFRTPPGRTLVSDADCTRTRPFLWWKVCDDSGCEDSGKGSERHFRQRWVKIRIWDGSHPWQAISY